MRHKAISRPAPPAAIHILRPSLLALDACKRIPGVDYCAASRQAAGAGRDFFDFVPLGGDTLVAAIGHAFGAGSAAWATFELQRLMRGLTAANCGEISRVMESLNRAICGISGDPFYATLFYGWIDCARSRLRYVSVGFLPPLLIRSYRGQARTLVNCGALLGLTPGAEFRERSMELEGGDILVAFGGGKGDARHRDDVLEVVLEEPGLRAATLAARILDRTGRAVSVVRFEEGMVAELRDLRAEEPMLAAS